MITTRFEKYCENCIDIDPIAEVLTSYSDTVHISIHCSREVRCANICKSIEEFNAHTKLSDNCINELNLEKFNKMIGEQE